MEVEEGGEEERMASGSRLPTSKERENNKRRERRRRAIGAKIYAGLRMYGNYKLPKHCDNNEVLKALCREAGWVVEEDGSTYREGCKPTDLKEIASTSTSPSPSSSYQPSPASSSYIVNAPSEVNTMPPFLSDLTPLSSSKAPPLHCHRHQHLHLLGGSISAPVTPPLSSPSARSPRMKMTYWDDLVTPRLWYPPSSSSHHFLPGGPSTPSISLVSSYDFGGFSSVALVPPAEFVFGAGRSSSKEEVSPAGPVKAWAGEKIHEECGTDELELTLGGSKRSNA